MTPQIILYTREGCGLCDDALAVILRLQPRFAFDFRTANIDDDPGLRARFDEQIPVVELDGRIVARAPVDCDALRRALERALAPR